MQRIRPFIVTIVLLGVALAQPALTMPKFMDRYDADPFAKAELKGKCTVCHTTEEGLGRLNAFGKAFETARYRITDELRKQAADKFGTTAAPQTPAFDVKAYYAKNCAACHGAEGKGGEMVGIPNFADSAYQQRRTDERLIEVIIKGKGTMPAWKDRLTDEQIKAMVAFIRKFPER